MYYILQKYASWSKEKGRAVGKAFVIGAASVTATVMPMTAQAAWVDDVKAAVNEGFSNGEAVMTAIVVGFATIFAIKLALRLIK